MLAITGKNLWAHKRRLLSTFVAVVLGVAFLSGTLVLSDTMRANFDQLFGDANRGTDAVIRAQPVAGSDEDGASIRLIDQSLLTAVRSVNGVARAEPVVEGYGRLVGHDGRTIGGSGPPTVAGNWIDDPTLNPYRLAEGRLPQADDEVVINRGAATMGNLHVGEVTTVQTPAPVRVRIVGLSTFGDVDSAGGLTSTAFTLAGAQANVTGQPGQVSSISVAASPGVGQPELVERLRPVLPPGVQAITGQDLTAEQTKAINDDFLDFFTWFLRVFAVIALVVATFSIYNTFSIIAAQRKRESALFRALGASRGQVLSSTLVEAVAIGVAASIVGVVAGIVVAVGLKGLLASIGLAIPAAGLTITGAAIVTSLTVGIVVTVLAGMLPAVRSSRTPPIAALRDVAVDARQASRVRVGLGTVTAIAGAALVVLGATGRTGNGALTAGLGALLTIAGVVVLGPVLADPLARLIGAPLPRLRGVTGSLARENARRSPRRTASTAAALMIGVGVVTLFTIAGASLKASVSSSVQQSFGGDLVVNTDSFDGGFTPRLATDVRGLPQVSAAAGIGNTPVLLDGKGDRVAVTDPADFTRALDIGVAEGSLSTLGDRQLAVSRKFADARGWRLGTTVPVTFADGAVTPFTIGAVYTQAEIMGDLIISRAAAAPHSPQQLDRVVLVKLADGVSLDAGRQAVETVTASQAGAQVRDRDQYLDQVAGSINQLLALVYVMLVLAVIIALMGIANTLSLSIHERTRELGLLRAVGGTRRQVRAMVRWESVIIALFGTVAGLVLGTFLGWAMVRAAASSGGLAPVVATPVGSLLVVLLVGGLAGIVAALRPARRAARLDVLAAIASE